MNKCKSVEEIKAPQLIPSKKKGLSCRVVLYKDGGVGKRFIHVRNGIDISPPVVNDISVSYYFKGGGIEDYCSKCMNKIRIKKGKL